MNSKKRLGLWTTLEGGARSAWEEQLVEVDRLKTSIDDLKKSVNQLNDLKREYQRQISSSARDSIEQFKFLRIREFLTTIDSTLEQARVQEESLVSSLSKATEDSTSLMLEMKKYNILKERHQKNLARAEDILEQKNLDQVGSRVFRRQLT
jgi:flagellar FliJ protein